eukprot:9878686-Karenia_brevis.AAC.1
MQNVVSEMTNSHTVAQEDISATMQQMSILFDGLTKIAAKANCQSMPASMETDNLNQQQSPQMDERIRLQHMLQANAVKAAPV